MTKTLGESMFIPIVFNTEYMDYDSRKVWYLKNLFHCKNNNWPLITHEYLKVHFSEILKGVDARFFEEFEMEPLEVSELVEVDQYFVPDEIFNNIQNRFDSRTEALTHLYTKIDPDLKVCLKDIIDSIIKKDPHVKISGILHCLDSFKTIQEVSNYYQAPLISYVFSAIRKVHGYRETLYCANISDSIFCSDQCENRYQAFTDEKTSFPVLEHRELIALLGKPRTFPLIPLMNEDPKHEICICAEAYSLTPQIFMKERYTDEDIFYECKNLFPLDRIVNRQHPYKLDQLKINRSEVKHDPAAMILSSKRVAAVSSQIVLKAMLWNRVVVMKKKTLPLSFACETEMNSCKKVDLAFLNYYMICYLIPSDLMFSEDYWVWRLASPLESEIYEKHLDYYMKKFSLSEQKLNKLDPDKRFEFILRARGCDNHTISNLSSVNTKGRFCYTNALSKIRIESSNSYHEYWCLNEHDGSEYVSRFSFDLDQEPSNIYFYPLEDKAGFVSIKKVAGINNYDFVEPAPSDNGSYRYFCQNNGRLLLDSSLLTGQVDVEVTWAYRDIHNHSQQMAAPIH